MQEIIEIEKNLEIMDEIIHNGQDTFEDEEKLEELYYKIKDLFNEINEYCEDNRFIIAKKKFKQLCSEFETPDDAIGGIHDMMFPNE
jgi:hypothetical protein